MSTLGRLLGIGGFPHWFVYLPLQLPTVEELPARNFSFVYCRWFQRLFICHPDPWGKSTVWWQLFKRFDIRYCWWLKSCTNSLVATCYPGLFTCCVGNTRVYTFQLGTAGVCPSTSGWQPLDGGSGSVNKNWHSRHNAGCVGPRRTMGRCHGVMARLCLQRLWTYKMCWEERSRRLSGEQPYNNFIRPHWTQ